MSNLIKKSVQAMHGYVPGEQPSDPKVVKLNTNENPYLPSPGVQDVLSMVDVATLSRYPDPTASALREAIAELHDCSPEQVFVGNGSDEVLALCLRAFVERDGSVGWFDPSYSLYPTLTAIEELQAAPVALDEDFGWNMPENYQAALFFLTNPNAPTSLLFPKEKIANFADSFKGVLVVDEAYADFAKASCLDLALSHKNVLVARTLSKSYSLAGIRLGYCVGDADLIAAMMKVKDSYNVDYLTQEIALAAIRDQDTMRANVEAICETRKLVSDSLIEQGFDVLDSRTNFLWIKPPEGLSAHSLFEKLRSENILVRYFAGSEKTRHHLRVTIGTAPEMFSFLDALKNILNKGK